MCSKTSDKVFHNMMKCLFSFKSKSSDYQISLMNESATSPHHGILIYDEASMNRFYHRLCPNWYFVYANWRFRIRWLNIPFNTLNGLSEFLFRCYRSSASVVSQRTICFPTLAPTHPHTSLPHSLAWRTEGPGGKYVIQDPGQGNREIAGCRWVDEAVWTAWYESVFTVWPTAPC